MKRGYYVSKGKKNPHSGGLNIMIVGCGKVGMTLVDRLSKEGHDISVVDKNAARLQSVTICMMYMG